MTTVNTKGLMLGLLAIGGFIASGALMAGQAYAQTATVAQANVNEDNDVQVADADACQAIGLLAGANVCDATIDIDLLDGILLPTP